MNSVIEPLINQRSLLKKKKDSFSQAYQNSLKTVVNTSYGIIASSHFEINNIMISDLITSTVRSQVWLMAKALNLNLTITDGGPYSLQSVSFFKDFKSLKKPGLEQLSSYYRYGSHRSLYKGNLGGINWEQEFQSGDELATKFDLDSLATNHLKTFWAHYSLPITFGLEHKPQNIFKKGVYMSKSHYAFLNYNKLNRSYTDSLYKIRGVQVDKRFEYPINPMFHLLEFMLHNDLNENDKFVMPNQRMYKHFSLLKLQGWRRSLISAPGKTKKSEYGILPGNSILLDRHFRLNNTHMYIDTCEVYYKRSYRTFKKKSFQTPEGLIIKKSPNLFEKYFQTLGIKKTIELMASDNLRFYYK